MAMIHLSFRAVLCQLVYIMVAQIIDLAPSRYHLFIKEGCLKYTKIPHCSRVEYIAAGLIVTFSQYSDLPLTIYSSRSKT
ncbi:hypothetical protein BJ138DRAFT_1145551 [Hygrophoropsis aurantiaca]|uniref:Uncharacterized protein n=1 Tax=Hygrophoropsis aurantiaca TaxID=72124 RepID=A0ACB8AKD1_9AGAM|nr:hypothetical protein BJ138DRAFT_1145551 [Hygrophoropsis aurantiaca]